MLVSPLLARNVPASCVAGVGGEEMAEDSRKDKQSGASDGGNADLMTGGEVAAFLRVHIASVRRWARSGQLRGYRLGGRGDWRFHRKDVMAFLSGLTGQS